jgi:RNA recognition motif-containing protein
MGKKLFVGNLAWEVTAQDLRDHFGEHGEISDAFVATDKMSGRSRGFGFVEFATEEAAAAAKDALDKSELKDREINIDWAQPSGRSNDA